MSLVKLNPDNIFQEHSKLVLHKTYAKKYYIFSHGDYKHRMLNHLDNLKILFSVFIYETYFGV